MSRKPKQKKVLSIEQQVRRRTLRAFVIFFALLGAGWVLFMRLYHEQREDGVQATLRKGLRLNERLFSSTFSTRRIAKKYAVSEAAPRVRVNGDLGTAKPVDTVNWRMKVVRMPGDTLQLTLDDIKRLPRTDVVFDFKCIEGWDQVTHWGGVRFSDFIKAYHLDAEMLKQYAGLQTPDKQYYVGIDMASMLQPQTILCYEVNGRPLPLEQGYPLRLIIPVKYGIKHLKRIGTLYFSNTRPPDYWAERGYDYYAGL
ncbi:MAG: molybdopterin-binding oxidoreductase [Bacteroidetes bacterium 46-16]|nr:MAG: molybdopterin-binding oxidoreductase [Bacteroidetes bacterium 46-16]